MKRFASQLLIALVCLAVTPCHAAKPLVRDGSSKERAIVLKQRGAAAVEEEIAWMRKLYHYTPIDSMRDMVADAIRRLKAGKKKLISHSPGRTRFSITRASVAAPGRSKRRGAHAKSTSILVCR
jgi:hypothetical protein